MFTLLLGLYVIGAGIAIVAAILFAIDYVYYNQDGSCVINTQVKKQV